MLSAVKAADPVTYERLKAVVAAATGEDPGKLGDGTILQWLIANGPAIMAFIMQIVALFGKEPTPPTRPKPVV